MPGNIREVLMRVVGKADMGEVEHDLERISGELAAFARESAQATVEVDTAKARATLDELKARLDRLGSEEVSPKANFQIAGAETKIAALQAELDRMDREDVTIDVDVRRGVVERIVALGGEVERLTGSLGGGGGGGGGLSGALSGATEGFSLLGEGGSSMVALAPVIAALIAAATGAIVALAASAVAAAAGLGAIAVAGGALLLPFLGLAIGAIARFKAEAGTAGTAAHALSGVFSEVGSAAAKAFGPGLDAVLRGAARGLSGLPALVRSLGPAFTQFGQAAGTALQGLLKSFTSPQWAGFFSQLLAAATQTVGPLVSIFQSFAGIMRNIASAALPFVVSGLSSVADAAKGLFQGSGTEQFRSDIAGLIGQLRTWLGLLAQVGRILGGVFKAAAGPGQQLVQFFSDGAKKIADWVNSAQGQERIKQFFTDTLPLARQLVTTLAQLAVIALQIGEAFAPTIAFILAGFNWILGAIIKVDEALRTWGTLGAALGSIFAPVLGAITASFSAVISAATAAWNAVRSGAAASVGATVAAFNAVRAAAGAAWSWVRQAAAAAFAGVRAAAAATAAAVSAVISAGRAAWGWIAERARAVAGTVRGVISGLAGAVGGLVSRAAGSAWHWIADAARQVAGVVRGVISALVGWIKGRINDAITVIHHITDAINAAKSAVESFVGTLDSAIDKAGDLIDKVKSLPGKALSLLAGGTRNWPGGLAIVGEQGPELINLPRGADVFSASETSRIIGQLGGALRGVTSPDLTGLVGGLPSAPAPAAAGAVTNIEVSAPPGEAPDVETFLAQVDSKLRARGIG
jgi:phage-related protein